MDDYLLAGVREDVERIQNLLAGELKKLELEINRDKTVLSPLQQRADFLGCHISTLIRVKRETRDKMLKTLSTRYREGGEERFWSSVAGMHGHACWSNDSITQLTSLCAKQDDEKKS